MFVINGCDSVFLLGKHLHDKSVVEITKPVAFNTTIWREIFLLRMAIKLRRTSEMCGKKMRTETENDIIQVYSEKVMKQREGEVEVEGG